MRIPTCLEKSPSNSILHTSQIPGRSTVGRNEPYEGQDRNLHAGHYRRLQSTATAQTATPCRAPACSIQFRALGFGMPGLGVVL